MRAARLLLGLFFIGTGAFKLWGGAAGFAVLLVAAGVPFAALNAWLVIAVEIGCGSALVAAAVIDGARTKTVAGAAAAILAVDMVVAVLTVGLRTQRGEPVLVDGVPTAAEPWRLGLEVFMLVALGAIAATSLRGSRDAFRRS